MTTTRTQARAEIVAALTTTGVFADVSNGLPQTFDRSPIAVVRSQSYDWTWETRELKTYTYGLAVTIYVDLKTGTSVQVETQLDDLVAATMATIVALEGGDDTKITVGPSAPPDGEVLQRIAEGKVYRVERIPILWEAEG